MNKELIKKIIKNPSIIKHIDINLNIIKDLISYSYGKENAITFLENNKLKLIENLNKNLNEFEIDNDLGNFLKELKLNISYAEIKMFFSYFVKNNEKLIRFLIDNNYFIKNHGFFKQLYFEKDNKIFIKVMKENNKLFEYFLYESFYLHLLNNKELLKGFLNYLIDIKHFLIFPKTKEEFIKSFRFLDKIKPMPDFVLEYINQNKELKEKLFKEQSKIDLIDKILSDYKEKKDLENFFNSNNLNEEEINYFYSKIKINTLLYRKGMYEFLENEIKFNILNKELKDKLYFISILLKKHNDLEKYCEYNFTDIHSTNRIGLHDKDLRILTFVEKDFLRKNYKKIKENILNGVPIGKQALKYFLLKNKDKLDRKIISFALNKYPRLYNSLNLKIKVNFKSNIRSFISLKDLIYKKNLSLVEVEYIKTNIHKVLNIKNLTDLNPEVSKLIKEYYAKEFK